MGSDKERQPLFVFEQLKKNFLEDNKDKFSLSSDFYTQKAAEKVGGIALQSKETQANTVLVFLVVDYDSSTIITSQQYTKSHAKEDFLNALDSFNRRVELRVSFLPPSIRAIAENLMATKLNYEEFSKPYANYLNLFIPPVDESLESCEIQEGGGWVG